MEEPNKLIAEFMGYVYEDDRFFMEDSERVRLYEYLPHELRYHTSWDWLMPVVSKCREESNAEDSHWEAIYYSIEGCDIDVTYQAVVEFIKQHNKKS